MPPPSYTKRLAKGSPLTNSELDANWEASAAAFAALETALAAKAPLTALDAKDFGAVGNGTANDHAALTSAMDAAAAAGRPLSLGPGTYGVASTLSPPSGLRLVGTGAPRVLWIGSGSADLVKIQSKQDVSIEGVVLDRAFATGGPPNGNCLEAVSCQRVTMRRVTTLRAADEAVRFTGGSDFLVDDCDLSDTPTQEAVAVDGAARVRIRRSRINRNFGFGVFCTNGSQDVWIDENEMLDNGLEAVGVRYSCWRGHVRGCHIRGSGDNGVSITGSRWTVADNQIEGCDFHGVCIFGSFNVVSGNQCWDNGAAAAGATLYQSGVAVRPGFGGLGSHNVIAELVAGDSRTGGAKTQQYAVSFSSHLYTEWASGQTISVTPSSAQYRTAGLNLYEALGSGTTGAQPTHTAGDVAGADGITWRFIASTVAAEGWQAKKNRVRNVVDAGNAAGSFYTVADAQQNAYERDGELYFAVPGGNAATSNWTGVISTNVSPAGAVAGTPGMLALRRSGSIAGRGAYVYSDAWAPLLERRAAATASRTLNLGSADAGNQYFDTTLGRPIWWNGTGWVDATGTAV